jgi:hypothetical protein
MIAGHAQGAPVPAAVSLALPGLPAAERFCVCVEAPAAAGGHRQAAPRGPPIFDEAV